MHHLLPVGVTALTGASSYLHMLLLMYLGQTGDVDTTARLYDHHCLAAVVVLLKQKVQQIVKRHFVRTVTRSACYMHACMHAYQTYLHRARSQSVFCAQGRMTHEASWSQDRRHLKLLLGLSRWRR